MQQMQQYEKVRLTTGQVENVVTQPGRYAIKVAGEWYSAFERACPVSQGQQVAIAFVESGRFRNIKALLVLATGKSPGLSETVPRGFGPRDRFMALAVALKAAASCYGSEVEVNTEAIKRLADTFAEWLISKSTGTAPTPTLCDCEVCKCPKLKGTQEPDSLICVSCGGEHA